MAGFRKGPTQESQMLLMSPAVGTPTQAEPRLGSLLTSLQVPEGSRATESWHWWAQGKMPGYPRPRCILGRILHPHCSGNAALERLGPRDPTNKYIHKFCNM